MTVDVRAKVFCNLGTVIQGNLADEALSAGQGLITCRGQVVLDGLSTPAVGSTVNFGWTRGNTIARIPRTLRVLSSFADPFRGTTTVQLGDKLVYLANLRAAKAEEEDPDGTNGPDPANYPSNEYDYDSANACYLPKAGAKPFNFSTPDAASKLTVREEYALAPAKVMGRAPMGIYASSVLSKCCMALGISSTGQSLTNVYQDDFDLSSGYVSVIDQLLSSESLFGYLTESETLQIVSIDGYGTGPLITTDELIDLSGINQGILPGQTVSVTFNYKRLKDTAADEAQQELDDQEAAEDVLADPASTPEEEAAAQAELDAIAEAERLRNWEEDESVTYNQEYTFTVEDAEGATVYSATFSHNPSTLTRTTYDDSNYATLRRSVEKRIVASEVGTILQAVINAKYEAGEIGGAQTGANDTLLRQAAQSELEFITEETFEYEEVKEEATNEPQALPPDKLCPDPTGTERVADEDATKPKQVEKRQVKTTVTRYEPLCSLLAKMNVSGYDFSTYDLSTLPTAPYISERTVTYYDTNQPTGQTKTRVDRYLAYAITLDGQQYIAEKGTNVTTTSQLNALLQQAQQLVFSHTEVSIQRDRTFGVQQRPSKEQLQAEDKDKDLPVGGGNDKGQQQVDLQQENSSVESSPKTEVPLPLASDDAVVWTANNGYEFKGSNAASMAARYARTVNALLRGNRAGVSLQLAAKGMPLYPLSTIYLQAGGLTASYKSNGMSWSFNSDGVLCAMDALYVSGISGTGTRWFPVAPGITTLPSDPTVSTNSAAPANSTTTPSGFNPAAPGAIFNSLPTGQAPIYAQSIAPSSGVPVVNETLPVVAGTRSIVSVLDRDYALTLPTGTAVLATKARVSATKVEGVVVPLVVKALLADVIPEYPGGEEITRDAILEVKIEPEVVKYDGPLIAFGHDGNTSTGGVYLTMARVYANSVANVSSSLSAQPASRIVDVSFTPDGTRLGYLVRTAPWLGSYTISNNIFTRQTPNAESPSSYGQSVFSPRGDHLFIEDSFASPYYSLFRTTPSGFSRIVNALDVVPTSRLKGFAYSADDRYFAVTYSNTLRIYEKSGDSYISIASTTLPASVSVSTGGLSWTPDNQYLAAGLGSAPFLAVYSFSGTSLTSVTTGITVSAGVVDTQFSPNGKYLAVAITTAPRLLFYKRTGSTFTQLTSNIPTSDGTIRAIAWSGYGDYFVAQVPFQGQIWKVTEETDTFTQPPGGAFNLPNDVFSAGSLAVYPLPPVVRTLAQGATNTITTKLSISAVAFDPSSPQAFQEVNAAPRLGASPATSSTGWTLIQSTNDDDMFSSAVSLPFNVTIDGVASNQVFVESNSYLTFGTGSGSIPYDATAPEIEKLLVVPGDYSFQRVYVKVGTNYALLRYEGFSQYTGTTPGNSNIIWEVALTQPAAGNSAQVIEARLGINDAIDSTMYGLDKLEICNKTTALASITGAKNTSYILQGNATGSAWTVMSGYSLTAI